MHMINFLYFMQHVIKCYIHIYEWYFSFIKISCKSYLYFNFGKTKKIESKINVFQEDKVVCITYVVKKAKHYRKTLSPGVYHDVIFVDVYTKALGLFYNNANILMFYFFYFSVLTKHTDTGPPSACDLPGEWFGHPMLHNKPVTARFCVLHTTS